MVLWIILGIFGIIAILGMVIFNQLVGLRQMTHNGWSDIEVQLKRRADLIPQLVRTVKAYAKHEKDLFTEIVEKRNQALAAGADMKSRGAAEHALGRPMSRLLAIAEDYPDLKANENYLDLQYELADTEDKIEMARRFYNGAVRGLNTKVQSVPANIIAGMFNFKAREYFELAAGEGKLPDVNF